MFTFLVAIIGQSVNVSLNPGHVENIQASHQPNKVHNAAPRPPTSLTNELDAHVESNKDKLNNWLKEVWKKWEEKGTSYIVTTTRGDSQ